MISVLKKKQKHVIYLHGRLHRIVGVTRSSLSFSPESVARSALRFRTGENRQVFQVGCRDRSPAEMISLVMLWSKHN